MAEVSRDRAGDIRIVGVSTSEYKHALSRDTITVPIFVIMCQHCVMMEQRYVKGPYKPFHMSFFSLL